MATELATLPTQIERRINYFLPVECGGCAVIYPGTAGEKLRKHDAQDMTVTDLRAADENFTLDKNGFQFVSHGSAEKTFEDADVVKTLVYDETSELLKKITGATHAFPFSHIIRRHLYQDAIDASRKLEHLGDIVPLMNPATFCHVDQSYAGAVQVLQDNLSEADAKRLSKTRWGIINVWRPIGRPVKREPLAVCDWLSVRESDLTPVAAVLPGKGKGTFDNVFRGKGFEISQLLARPDHRWYYASHMTPGETLMIKCFDSKKDGRARCSPHSAFQTKFDEGPPKESIEVRCLVFWEDQSPE